MAHEKILVVDDDEKILRLINVLLLEREYRVITLNNPKEAIKEIKKFLPQLIIMDIMMPGMYGSELAGLVKKDAEIKDIPIIFLTGLRSDSIDDDDRSKIKVGEDYYTAIAKPFGPEELLCEVRIALKKGTDSI